ncbi:TIR domain-containing protein [Pelagibacterium xiamenense]|uniref:TIR domain-containing protein n=1 Tax=Pelagibacterium xiamenense TaxID=2901140 RepID=UPI001E2B519C|nr:TIR domain-containing protein [Pelagibacterium xiamenense]MCD7059127.1 nucleotide-binding protein [Pelagibacterium xiamenense]
MLHTAQWIASNASVRTDRALLRETSSDYQLPQVLIPHCYPLTRSMRGHREIGNSTVSNSMRDFEELFSLAENLRSTAELGHGDEFNAPLEALQAVANKVQKSFSGSWLGYHSRVYYANLVPAPPGANFSQEWGLKELFGDMGSHGDWREFDAETVKGHIADLAGNPDLTAQREAAEKAIETFRSCKSDILSILGDQLEQKPDRFLQALLDELEALKPMSVGDVVQHWSPSGQIMTRDMVAMGQRTQVPPHIEPLAEVASIRHSFGICTNAADIAAKAASHLERKSRRNAAAERVGTNVFIGHGRAGAWRELKDFVQDRLGLPWDEFNRVPVAGVTNIARLSEMLDAAAVALLVLTAEDELADGGMQARMNVIHEAGLFQGRLGFTRAIVLLEEGCEEFSNIQGLGQIRFPRGNIGAAFEEVRRVLEREKLIGDN